MRLDGAVAVGLRVALAPAVEAVVGLDLHEQPVLVRAGIDQERPDRLDLHGARSRVGFEAGGLDAGHRTGLVLVRDVARDAHGADHRAAGVADQHAAGHGHHAPVRHGVERREERVLLRVVGEALGEGPRADAHAEGAPGLAQRDLRAEDAGAVLAPEGLEVSAAVEDGHGQRCAARLAAPARGPPPRSSSRAFNVRLMGSPVWVSVHRDRRSAHSLRRRSPCITIPSIVAVSASPSPRPRSRPDR